MYIRPFKLIFEFIFSNKFWGGGWDKKFKSLVSVHLNRFCFVGYVLLFAWWWCDRVGYICWSWCVVRKVKKKLKKMSVLCVWVVLNFWSSHLFLFKLFGSLLWICFVCVFGVFWNSHMIEGDANDGGKYGNFLKF